MDQCAQCCSETCIKVQAQVFPDRKEADDQDHDGFCATNDCHSAHFCPLILHWLQASAQELTLSGVFPSRFSLVR